MKKLKCHCGEVEAEINLDGDLAKVNFMRLESILIDWLLKLKPLIKIVVLKNYLNISLETIKIEKNKDDHTSYTNREKWKYDNAILYTY